MATKEHCRQTGTLSALIGCLCLAACGDTSERPTDPSPDDEPPAIVADDEAGGPTDEGTGSGGGLDLSQFDTPVLVYSADRDGDHDIFLALPDGSLELSLTDGPSEDTSPAWSPDGAMLVFVSDRNGTPEIWLMDSGGGNKRLFGERAGSEVGPKWSPNGREIAFLSMDNGNWDIYQWEIGAEPVNLTASPSSETGWSWAPVGRLIAYRSSDGQRSQIHVLDLESGQTHDLGPGTDPAWSPDGMSIAFASDREGQYSIWMSNVDGSEQRDLTGESGSDFRPSWSPDGTTLAYMSDSIRPTFFDVMTIGTDGTGQRTLHEARLVQPFPLQWAPDGSIVSYAVFDLDSREWLLNLLDMASLELFQLGLVHSFAWAPLPD